MMAHVKVREVGQKRFYFLASGGKLSRLKIHAVRFGSIEKAQDFIAANSGENPEFEFRAVKA